MASRINSKMNSGLLTMATLFLLFCFGSCIKEKNKKSCWIIIDNNGNDFREVCDKTEAELVACAANGTCTGVAGSITLTSCNYYRAGGSTFCWYGNGGVFVKDVTEDKLELLKRCYGLGNVSKVDCSYCGTFYSREKRTYKPTGGFVYSAVHVQQYCGDTARTLFHGREVVRKDDADSLIVIQFSNSGIFF